MKKRKENFSRVIAGAYVVPSKGDANGFGKMLIKVQAENSEPLVGLRFDDVKSVESCIFALNRIKSDLEKFEGTPAPYSAKPSKETH